MKKIIFFLFLSTAASAFAESAHSLQAFMGTRSLKYNLESEQFSADLPRTYGKSYQVNYGLQSYGSNLEHLFSMNKSEYKIAVPTGLTPNEINLTENTLNYHLNIDFDSYKLGGSYSFNKVNVDNTSPNVLISGTESHILGLHLSGTVWHKANLSIELLASLGLPISRKEIGTQTGFNQFTYTVHAGYLAKYLLTEAWSILQESNYSLSKTSFDGEGTRDTLNATEQQENVTLLVGAGYDF